MDLQGMKWVMLASFHRGRTEAGEEPAVQGAGSVGLGLGQALALFLEPHCSPRPQPWGSLGPDSRGEEPGVGDHRASLAPRTVQSTVWLVEKLGVACP